MGKCLLTSFALRLKMQLRNPFLFEAVPTPWTAGRRGRTVFRGIREELKS